MGSEKIVTGVLVAAIITGAALLYLSLSSLQEVTLKNSQPNYQQFSSNENTEDICAVPPGTDPVSWKEHMGHHPDKYAQCLK